jgi:hypothetical protein
MVVAAAHYDMGNGVRQSEYHWVLTTSSGAVDAQSGFFPSIEEQYQQQFEMPFESVVDESAVFKALAEKWRRERGSTSSMTEMVVCPAYQNIIGMGPKAIRFIISELRAEGDNPDHWFWALQALTRMNPVSEENEGNLNEMAKAWLSWAALEGYAR